MYAIRSYYASRDWHRSGRPLLIAQWRLALCRGFLVAFAQICFYVSLAHLVITSYSIHYTKLYELAYAFDADRKIAAHGAKTCTGRRVEARFLPLPLGPARRRSAAFRFPVPTCQTPRRNNFV